MKRKYSGKISKRPYKKMKLVKQLSLGLSLEKKFLDTTLATTSITGAGIIVNNTLVGMVQGVTQSTRIGRKITVKNILLRGHVTKPQTTVLSLTEDWVRVIVYQDTQTNGAAATVAGILQTADEKSYQNLENVQRYNILKDWYVHINSQNVLVDTTGAAYIVPVASSQKIKLNKKCTIPIYYNTGNNGDVTDITSNNIGVMAISQNASLSFMEATVRIRYTDD